MAAFVKDPECLVLELSPASEAKLPLSSYECIRAKIGLELLERQSLMETATGVRVVFAGPKKPSYRRGYKLAFVALMPRQELNKGYSKFRLHRIAWRKDMVSEANIQKSDRLLTKTVTECTE